MKTLGNKKKQDKGLYLMISSVLLEQADRLAISKGLNRSEFIRHLLLKAVEEAK
jgi:metal-responsive CopG/Arc/MetJ family transcriptional regulator